MAKTCVKCKSKIGVFSNHGSDNYPLCFSCHAKNEKQLENNQNVDTENYIKNTKIMDFKDDKNGCWSRINLADGSPLFISIAKTGVLVRKSKSGLFGTLT